MEQFSEIRNLLLRTFREYRIHRRLSFDSALPGLHGVGTPDNPIEIEDSDDESALRATQRQPTTSNSILYQRATEFIRGSTGSPEAILLLFNALLNRMENLETKIAFLQAIINYEIEGGTDEETDDTATDEDED